MADVVVTESGLAEASPADLATALAWRSARFGARQTGKAIRRMPRAMGLIRKQLPKGPLARAAEQGFSLWSSNSRWSVASMRSHTSGLSIWSMFSAGSVGSIGSIASVGSLGSAGSLLSIGSAGSILSIGAAGSVLSIGGVNQQPWKSGPVVDGDDAANPTLTVIEQGGALIGVLALAGAARATLRGG